MRYFLIILAGLVVAAAGYGALIWSVYWKNAYRLNLPEDRAAMQVEVTPLKDGFFMLHGDGGNITLMTGPDGVLIVDTGEGWAAPQVQDKIREIAGGDPVFLINTHSHGDHRGGNALFRATGADIIAHRIAVEEMRADDWAVATPQDIPTIIIGDEHSFDFNGETILLHHVPAAHTSGDIFVHFTGSDVLTAGDIFFNRQLPFLSLKLGGTLDGHIRGQVIIDALIGDQTIVIPGHGPVGNRADLRATTRALTRVRADLARLRGLGVTETLLPLFHPLRHWPAEWRGLGREKLWSSIAYATIPAE